MFLDQKFLSSQTIKLYTDALSDIGFAAVFGKKWVAGTWHKPFTSADITLLELYPLVLATELFGKFLANHCIIFMTDNSGVVDIINKSTSKNRAIMKLVRKLVLACLKYNILFRSRHFPGNQNIITDHTCQPVRIQMTETFSTRRGTRAHVGTDVVRALRASNRSHTLQTQHSCNPLYHTA